MNSRPTTTHRTRRSAVVGALASLALVTAACGSDEAAEPAPAEAPGDDTPVATEPAAEDGAMEEPMADDAMEDEAMEDEAMEESSGFDEIAAELVAAGLTEDQAACVIDAAADEFGDAMTGAGSLGDAQLLRLGEITFGCV